jgi:hypothetical protein
MLKGRHFRRLSAIACFASCALAVILWIRSYRGNDHVDICYAANQSVTTGGQQSPGFRLVSANTSHGIVSFHVDPAYLKSFDPAYVRTGVHYHASEARDDWWWKREAKFGFAYRSTTSSRGHLLAIPFWFLTLLTAAAGTLLWKDRPYRFTLRGVLIATTFVAVVLGVGAALSRQ